MDSILSSDEKAKSITCRVLTRECTIWQLPACTFCGRPFRSVRYSGSRGNSHLDQQQEAETDSMTCLPRLAPGADIEARIFQRAHVDL